MREHNLTEAPVEAAPEVAESVGFDTAHPVVKLQRQVGNRYVQRIAQGSDDWPDDLRWLSRAISARRAHGHRLDLGLRARMETAFGYEFGDVRLHTDPEADALSRAIHARAFTTGRDIFFREGEYRPNTTTGSELIAHELAHVVQQGGHDPAPGAPLAITEPHGAAEREADAAAQAAMGACSPAPLRPEAPGVYLKQDKNADPLEEPLPLAIERVSIKPDVEKLRARMGEPANLSIWSQLDQELQETLTSHGFDLRSFREYQRKFADMFQKRAYEVTLRLLDDGQKIAAREQGRYEGTTPESRRDAEGLRSAAQELARLQWSLIGLVQSLPMMASVASTGELNRAVKAATVVTPANLMELLSDPLVRNSPAIARTSRLYRARLRRYGPRFPILLVRGLDFRELANASPQRLHEIAFGESRTVLESVREARERLTPEKIWGLPFIVRQTKRALGIPKGSGADMVINERVSSAAIDRLLWNLILAAVAIPLGIIAALNPLGLATAAAVVTGGLSAWGAVENYRAYRFERAAYHSALNPATTISKEEPGLFWLAVDLLAAGLDIGAATLAFSTVQKLIARVRLAREQKAVDELVAFAKAQYGALPQAEKASASEAKWIIKILTYAHQGVERRLAGQRLRLVAELLGGTSARAAQIRKGSEVAIREVLVAHGDWKSLIELLEESGSEGLELARQFYQFRKRKVESIFQRFPARTEPGAATKAISDVDINVGGIHSGEMVLQLEEEMGREFGKNWSDVLRIHFYTEASRFKLHSRELQNLREATHIALEARQRLHATTQFGVTAWVEEFTLTKSLRHAKGDPAATARVHEVMEIAEAAGLRPRGGMDFRPVAEEAAAARRTELLLEIDRDVQAFRSMPESDTVARLEAASKISKKQMEANFYSAEALIGPGSMRDTIAGLEAYQTMLSWYEMLEHTIHLSGGDVLRACREYELWKYVGRMAKASAAAGYKNAKMHYFGELGNVVHRWHRGLHSEIAHLNIPPHMINRASPNLISDEFLRAQFLGFWEEAKGAFRVAAKKSTADPLAWTSLSSTELDELQRARKTAETQAALRTIAPER